MDWRRRRRRRRTEQFARFHSPLLDPTTPRLRTDGLASLPPAHARFPTLLFLYIPDFPVFLAGMREGDLARKPFDQVRSGRKGRNSDQSLTYRSVVFVALMLPRLTIRLTGTTAYSKCLTYSTGKKGNLATWVPPSSRPSEEEERLTPTDGR